MQLDTIYVKQKGNGPLRGIVSRYSGMEKGKTSTYSPLFVGGYWGKGPLVRRLINVSRIEIAQVGMKLFLDDCNNRFIAGIKIWSSQGELVVDEDWHRSPFGRFKWNEFGTKRQARHFVEQNPKQEVVKAE